MRGGATPPDGMDRRSKMGSYCAAGPKYDGARRCQHRRDITVTGITLVFVLHHLLLFTDRRQGILDLYEIVYFLIDLTRIPRPAASLCGLLFVRSLFFDNALRRSCF
jgi:hypothetical protein